MRADMKTRPRGLPLDSSAIIHLAVKRRGYTNSFRLSATLTDTVCPQTLQKAADAIAPRFPTIVAGIRHNMFQYIVVPAEKYPEVCLEHECLAEMPKVMIETCAMRILYSVNRISVEIFHSLTDGYGGMMFFNALLSEYLCRKQQVSRETTDLFQCCNVSPAALEADDYLTHTGEKTLALNHRKVYELPGEVDPEQQAKIITGIYDTQKLIDEAHRLGVSLTVFLTAVMAEAILEMRQQTSKAQCALPLQIMIPVNLRKRFSSQTLRNFSLYALPCITPSQEEMSFEQMLNSIAGQLRDQLSQENLTAMITTNVKLQKLPVLRFIPLCIKNLFLRIGFHFCGERNSCLSISNLGEVTFPPEMAQYVEHIDFSLTPRRNAPYNCGVASFKNKLAISFTKKTNEIGLDWYFFKCLANRGFQMETELVDYVPKNSEVSNTVH